MKSREDLQTKLEEILGSDHVYFQPPSNVKMVYPAIRYKLDGLDADRADNKRYIDKTSYSVTHIYKSLKNQLTDQMLDSFTYISFAGRIYDDGLYNDTYEIYW